MHRYLNDLVAVASNEYTDPAEFADQFVAQYIEIDSNIDPHAVCFPALKPWNSRPWRILKYDQLNNIERRRVLKRMLGAAVCELNSGSDISNSFTAVSTHSKIQIGAWQYQTNFDEDVKHGTYTRRSWFAINKKDVPEYKGDTEFDFLIGHFINFIKVSVPAWDKDSWEHHIARCHLYVPMTKDPITNLLTFHKKHSILKHKYVTLSKVHSPVALAPELRGMTKLVPATQRTAAHSVPGKYKWTGFYYAIFIQK